MPTYQHFVLTRFNRYLFSANPRKQKYNPRFAHAWMNHRIALFNRYCLPSMKAQTCQNFTWLVFFDRNTPKKYISALHDLFSYKNFIPVYQGSFQTAVLNHLLPTTEYIITTRLDNDDAFHVTAIRRIQECFHGQDLLALNFPMGYRLANNRLFSARHLSNPFLSLIERVRTEPTGKKAVFTVMDQKHDEIHRIAKVKQLIAKPMWLQVIHGRNLKNRGGGEPLNLTFAQIKKDFGLK